MHVPVRFRLIAAFAVTAFACHYSLAQPAEPMTPAQIAEWAKSLPPGTQIEFEHVQTNEQAKGEGASLDATGDAVNTKVDSGAPNSKLSGGGGASGGKLQSNVSAERLATDWLPILTWLAAAVAGAFAFLAYQRGQIKQAISLGILAGGLAAVAFFPVLIPIGFGGALLWLLFHSGVLSKFVAHQRSEVVKNSLEATAAETIASNNYEALREVTEFIYSDAVRKAAWEKWAKEHSSYDDAAVVEQVRRADDLH